MFLTLLKLVCESLQSTYSPHCLPVKSFFFSGSNILHLATKTYIRLHGCAGSIIFCFRQLVCTICVHVRQSETEINYQTLQTQIKLNTQRGYDKVCTV